RREGDPREPLSLFLVLPGPWGPGEKGGAVHGPGLGSGGPPADVGRDRSLRGSCEGGVGRPGGCVAPRASEAMSSSRSGIEVISVLRHLPTRRKATLC